MTASPAAARPPSLWEDLLEIFYAPTAVFERRRETPAFGLALVILTVLLVGLALGFRGMMEPIFDAEFQRGTAQALKQNPNLTPEMLAKGKEFTKKFLPVIVAFYGLVTPLLLGLVLWFVGKLVDSKAQIGQTMMVATYAMFPRVLEQVSNALQTLILPDENLRSRYSVSLGVGRFLDPDTSSHLLLALLGRVDVFTLWITALMAIGLSVMGKIPLVRAVAAAALVWVVGALPGIWQAMRAG